MVSPQDLLIPVKQQKVYNQIVNQFIGLIERGEFLPGMQLPAERELAKYLSVSRASLREALTVLQMMGFVKTVSGQGTFICEKEEKNQPAFSNPLTGDESPFAILQARKVIEPAIAALAATQRPDDALKIMSNILDRVLADHSRNQVVGDVFSEGDREFHIEIARATGNSILIATQQMIHDLMGQKLWLALMRHSSIATPGRFEEAMVEHQGILEAIRSRESQLASSRAKAHLMRVEKIMQEAELFSDLPKQGKSPKH
jgi:DNA-binding FadR family transcriptional regulator